MSFREELKVLLTGDSKNLTNEMRGAKKQVNGFSNDVKKIGGMLAGAFAVGSVVAYGKRVAGIADEQNKLARRLNVTKGQADALELSFMKGGQSLRESEKSLDVFNRRLGELEAGEKTAADAFLRLGYTAEDFVGKDYTQKLIMIQKGLAGMTASARAFASQELFGRGGAKIFEGLKGLEASDRMIKEVNASLGLTGEKVGNIEEMNDRLTETSKKVELITTAMLTQLAPAIDVIATGAGKAAIAMAKMLGASGEAQTNKVGGLGGWFSAIGEGFDVGSKGGRTGKGAGGILGGVMGGLYAGVNRNNAIEMHETAANMRNHLEQGRPSPAAGPGGPAPPNDMLTQITGRADHEAAKLKKEAAAQTAEDMEAFGEMLGGGFKKLGEADSKSTIKKWTDALKGYFEGQGAPAVDLGQASDIPLEPMERASRNRIGEAGVTSASGLYSVAMQGAIGTRQSEQQELITIQERAAEFLEQIVRKLEDGIAYS